MVSKTNTVTKHFELSGYEKSPDAKPRNFEIVHHNLVIFGYWHIAALYGVFLCFTSAKFATIMFGFILFTIAEIGITAGSHRLWSHKTYKAKLPLQILLMVMNSIAFQNSIIDWVRDHRLHHKYSDTDADPHNASRGLFFSHVGWLLVRKHEDVKEKGKSIEMIDIYENPVLRFQKKYAIPFIGVVCFMLPTIIPMYIWEETFNNAWHITMLRYVMNLNVTFLVNSVAHKWGYKSYDKGILPAQNILVAIAAFGEGFHNYHHVFPWDYRTAELGNNYLNMTTLFINFFAIIGWAYDLKAVSLNVIEKRKKRTGDGTNLWGWNDKDFNLEDKEAAVILFPKSKKADTLKSMIHKESLSLKIQPSPWSVQGQRRGLSTELELRELRHNVLIYSLHNKWSLEYRSFCAGSIITEVRVLSSAKCFLTNRKKKRITLSRVRIIAGALTTVVKQPIKDDSQTQQWRSVKKIYSQMFLRFPAYNLCILETKTPWNFNSYIAKIPYATKDLDFDGVCESISLRAIKSWSKVKNVFREQLQMLKRVRCEHYLLRSCRLFYATVSITKLDHAYAETQGAGLICHDTGDPAEEEEGVLVAVTSLVNLDLPSLHSRVSPFHKWITDGASVRENDWLLIIIVTLINSL